MNYHYTIQWMDGKEDEFVLDTDALPVLSGGVYRVFFSDGSMMLYPLHNIRCILRDKQGES